MRRLAPLLFLGLAALSRASSPEYLKLRAQNGIHQAVGSAALREVVQPKTLEIQAKMQGGCRVDGVTTLVFEMPDGVSQEIEATNVPAWLADAEGASVRLLVRCSRDEKGAALHATLLAAAPELDVLPAEEAYWRGLAAKRKKAPTARPRAGTRPTASRSPIYGRIGGRSGAATREWIMPPNEATPRYASFIRNHNRRLTAGQATSIASALVNFSLRYGVDARLVVAVILAESDFDPNSVSRSGAVGLGQLMPETAQWMGVRNAYDTTDNLYGMVKLLRTHLEQYRTADGFYDLPRTLAAYNAGMGAVKRYGGVPPYRETQNYVRKVITYFNQLRGHGRS